MAVDGGEPRDARDHRSILGLMERRAAEATAVAERHVQSSLARVTEAMCEIVLDEAARHHVTAGRSFARRESIGVIPVALGIHALELDREISGSAVVLRIEPVWLATGSRSDLNDLDIDAEQAIHD